jgi:hypothetical protein
VFIGPTMSRSTACAVAVSAVVAALAVPAVASAKGDVRAAITSPTRCDAAAGRTITVRFGLSVAEPDGARRPFDGAEIFVVLRRHGAPGVKRRAVPMGRGTGRYRVRTTMPRGGVRRIDVGIEGVTIAADGTERPAPVLFRVTGDPCRSAG